MSEKTPDNKMPEDEALQFAKEVAEHHFGDKCGEATVMTGGLSNYVFEVDHRDGPYIIRMSDDPGHLQKYEKERWAQEQAQAVGVPTSEVLFIGTDPIGLPYMIAPKIKGVNAVSHPKRMEIIREMGQMLALVQKVRTKGFGRTFDWSGAAGAVKQTWRDFIEVECEAEGRLETLKRAGALAQGQLASLRDIIDDIKTWTESPVLNHGDMRLKNILVNKSGVIQAVIDWDEALSSIPPYWDLSIALHDLSIDAKEKLLDGYGITAKAFRKASPYIKAFNILNYVPVLKHAIDDGDEEKAEHIFTRLRGSHDLYLFS